MFEPSLKLDTMDEDTSFAEEYLRSNAAEIAELKMWKQKKDKHKLSAEEYKLAFKKLARKIEDNAELFAQLEFLNRKRPKHEVLKFDIQLLVKHFLYWGSEESTIYFTESTTDGEFDMVSDRPLADLGMIAHELMKDHSVILRFNDITTGICFLFTNLCQEVGLETVSLSFCDGSYTDKKWSGAVIIAQRSDLDSAIDVILASTSENYPWRLRRVWVQESVHKQFQKTLAWKCALKPSNAAVDEEIKSLSTKVFTYGGHGQKLFLIDYAGNTQIEEDSNSHLIIVEAYRTTKEMLALLTINKQDTLSIWSTDISEANELAFGVQSPLVWINDLGTFSGPPVISQSYYSNFIRLPSVWCSNNLLELKDGWRKLSIENRLNSLKKALTECHDRDLIKLFDKVDKASVISRRFVDIEKGKICVGTVAAKDLTCIYGRINDKDSLITILVSVVLGNGCMIRYGDESLATDKLKQAFVKEQVPIKFYDEDLVLISGYGTFGIGINDLYRTNVVWTNFGTAFAN